jgi:DNA (cytosine-5)-methyltransferase 1
VKHLSLFSGIGGFDLAAEWMGWTNIVSCEINEFGNHVLEYYWPNAYHHRDIHTLTGDLINEQAEKKFGKNWRADGVILTGGFPCQPFSLAGKRKGTDDNRYLWPEMLRIIREVQPNYVVAENVFGILNLDGGMVFEQVCLDLEAAGYKVQSYVLPACGVNAPHRRDRVWFVAHRNSDGQHTSNSHHEVNASEGGFNALGNTCESLEHESTTNTNSGKRCERRLHKTESQTAKRHIGTCNARSYQRPDWDNFPTQSPVCNGTNGIPDNLADITFSKWRNESIKAMGNAIVPQVAYQIFKAIQQTNDTK